MPEDPCLKPRGEPWEEVIPYQRPGARPPPHEVRQVDEPGMLWLVLPGLGAAVGLAGWMRWKQKRRRD